MSNNKRLHHLLSINAGISPTGLEPERRIVSAVPLRRYVGPVMFLLLSAGVFFYWSGIVLLNTTWYTGYTRCTQYVSSRYSFEWWVVWLLTLNAIPILLFALSLANNTVEEINRLHKWFSTMFIVVNGLVFILLAILWGVFCNSSITGGAACNDYRWCCVNFPSVWCPNAVPCNPAVVGSELSRNAEMTQHFIFSVVFGFIALFFVKINNDLREFKIFS